MALYLKDSLLLLRPDEAVLVRGLGGQGGRCGPGCRPGFGDSSRVIILEILSTAVGGLTPDGVGWILVILVILRLDFLFFLEKQ